MFLRFKLKVHTKHFKILPFFIIHTKKKMQVYIIELPSKNVREYLTK